MDLILLAILLPFAVSYKIPKVINVPQLKLSSQVANNHSRVFGGSSARDGQFPYMIFVYVNDGSALSRCSAALVSEDLVLLAAHCFPSGVRTNPSDVLATAGKANLDEYVKVRYDLRFNDDVPELKLNGAQERRGVELMIHQDYDAVTLNHDLAILRVGKPFVLTQNVNTIEISTESLKDTPCLIAGWGLTESATTSYHLVFASLVRTQKVGEGCDYKKTGNFYCLVKGSSGICQGDSGSPLVCENKLWGVASHFVAYTADAECGEDEEEYYVDISRESAFIKSVVGDFRKPPPETVTPKTSTGKSSTVSVISGLNLCILCGLLLYY